MQPHLWTEGNLVKGATGFPKKKPVIQKLKDISKLRGNDKQEKTRAPIGARRCNFHLF